VHATRDERPPTADHASPAGGAILLAGIVGSTAYGLAGPHSDVDRLGVYAAPTADFHGLHPPMDARATIVWHDPDVTLHEARKYVLLALSANPTVTELMWLPDDLYETRTGAGEELIAIRASMLCAPRVRDAYLGYAAQQFTRLINKDLAAKDPAKVAKHARHLLRLLDQGYALYTTGELRVRLDDPGRYLEFGTRVAADTEVARPVLAQAQQRFADARSVLPDVVDEAPAEDWLRRLRAHLFLAPAKEPT
jgi:uncharacterized protein